jgi:predicted secreted Zn-dependent protease
MIGELTDKIRAGLLLERDAEIEKVRKEAAARITAAKEDVTRREAAIRKQAISAGAKIPH